MGVRAYLLTQALLRLQKMLFNWPELGQQTLQLACNFQASSGRPYGPATALARMLQRTGWYLQLDATLKGPDNMWLHLKTDAPRIIRGTIVQAWAKMAPPKVAHRNGLHAMPAPALEDFRHVCSKFAPPQIRSLGLQFFGGFHSKAAQSLWDPFEDGVCRFCGARDTRHHRIFDCMAHTGLRRPFQPILDWVREHAPHWLHCTVPVEHKDEGVLRLIFQTRRVAPCSPPLCLVQQYALPLCNFYSDGTCAHPSMVPARHAAWAVVLDCAPTLDPKLLALHVTTTGNTPQSFHVVGQGLVPGRQSIDRAETLALLQICVIAQQMPEVPCVAYSDCQFALNLVQNWDGAAWRQSGRPPGLHHDLFQVLQVDGVPANLELRKVKAHANVEQAPESEVRHLLGNSVADEAAKQARLGDLSIVHDLLDEIYSWHVTQREALHMFLQYNLELTRAVATLDRQAATTGLDAARSQPQARDEIASAWLAGSTGVSSGGMPLELPPAWPMDSKWPQWFLVSIWAWHSSLTWPQQRAGRLRRGEGVTFLELLINFIAVTATLPPVRCDGSRALCDPLSPEGILMPLNQQDMVCSFASAVSYLTRVTGVPIFGVPRHHRIFSLVALGEAQPRKGLQRRPHMLAEELTAGLLSDFLATSRTEVLRDWALKHA